MKNMLRSKRAISPILATLLLVVIAVAAIVVTYAWVMTYMNAQMGQAGVFLTEDAVSWLPNSTIRLYVRNTGTSDATIDAVYIGTSSSNLDIQTGLIYDPPNGAVAAGGGRVSVTITYSWSTGTTYYFKVVPKVGPPLEFNSRAQP
jgi:flagellin-like protein